jgi:hypothetical protein
VARAPSPAKIHHEPFRYTRTKRVYTRARQLLQEGAGAAMKTLSHSEIILQLGETAAYGLTVTITIP